MMEQQWQYQIESFSRINLNDGKLTALDGVGKQGWEAVAIIPSSEASTSIKILFKKPLKNKS